MCKEKKLLYRIMTIINACENIKEDASQTLKDTAMIVAYERIKGAIENEDCETML